MRLTTTASSAASSSHSRMFSRSRLNLRSDPRPGCSRTCEADCSRSVECRIGAGVDIFDVESPPKCPFSLMDKINVRLHLGFCSARRCDPLYRNAGDSRRLRVRNDAVYTFIEDNVDLCSFEAGQGDEIFLIAAPPSMGAGFCCGLGIQNLSVPPTLKNATFPAGPVSFRKPPVRKPA